MPSPKRSKMSTMVPCRGTETQDISRLSKGLYFFSWKIRVVQLLINQHIKQRVKVLKTVQPCCILLRNDPEMLGNLFGSDESHSHLEGVVNENPRHLKSWKHPRASLATSAQRDLFAAFCHCRAFTGPWVFTNHDGKAETEKTETYIDNAASSL